MKNITIIGGSDGFGKWLANFIKKSFKNEVEITITGRNLEKLKKIAKEINCLYSNDNINGIKNADIVIFAVPIGHTEEIIKNVAPKIKKDTVILDVTSIKSGPSIAMKKYSPKGVLIIPTHPMFGPYVSTIAGQIFVLTPKDEDKKDKRYIFLKNFLEKNDAKVIETTPIEHDKMMAVVQGLTHFDMFVLGETIKRLGLDIEKSMNFVSPIYKIMISSVARYLNQNPKLYSDIQIYNKEVLKVHKIFMETTNDFNNFIKNKDEINFIKTVKNTAEYFGKNTQQGQEYTDKIIYMIGNQIEKAHKNIGNQIEITNIYDKTIIKGILEKIENNFLFINKSKYNLNTWEIN
ncbi:MAG: prephenate dehydrogenase/arogenate dehydrogenase family protein [Candidatus Gracilibacteria bacterium]|nr:prephenate dehydrogenase/arogenate dehydrogenase family protein [Candidatus Gracilibacteria bacterium]